VWFECLLRNERHIKRGSVGRVDIERYARRHPNFLGAEIPQMLARIARLGVIADIGCGDGATLAALSAAGLLGGTTFAVDLSETRVRNAERVASGITGVVADAASTSLPDGSVDGVVCSQVIEHVPDDRAVAREIARILRPGGWWYISSVVRRRRAWWLYRVEGERRLDPTHVREYRHAAEFAAALRVPGLEADELGEKRFWFPLGELVARAVGRRAPFPVPRWVAVSPPGYRLVESAGHRV
jgi:2-polyprenyl-3-methyl-5-hydroxy-6-metoxy-1,4-benzoquinol methylase